MPGGRTIRSYSSARIAFGFASCHVPRRETRTLSTQGVRDLRQSSSTEGDRLQLGNAADAAGLMHERASTSRESSSPAGSATRIAGDVRAEASGAHAVGKACEHLRRASSLQRIDRKLLPSHLRGRVERRCRCTACGHLRHSRTPAASARRLHPSHVPWGVESALSVHAVRVPPPFTTTRGDRSQVASRRTCCVARGARAGCARRASTSAIQEHPQWPAVRSWNRGAYSSAGARAAGRRSTTCAVTSPPASRRASARANDARRPKPRAAEARAGRNTRKSSSPPEDDVQRRSGLQGDARAA